jgi:hypothetical protein
MKYNILKVKFQTGHHLTSQNASGHLSFQNVFENVSLSLAIGGEARIRLGKTSSEQARLDKVR